MNFFTSYLFIFAIFILAIFTYVTCVANESIKMGSQISLFSQDLDCHRVLANDVEYIAKKVKHRITYKDGPEISVDCNAIKSRNFFATEPASDEERNFPLAFSRTVFRDYVFLEMELASTYAPQNSYCYALDKKSDKLFKSRIRSLGSCFDNVFVLDQEFDMDSTGHKISLANLGCMKLLIRERNWRYLITLQNHDVAIKTNQELVQIFKWFQGANHMEFLRLPSYRFKLDLDWTIGSLNLLRNGSSNYANVKLNFATGYVQSGLSRAYVDYLTNTLNVEKMLAQLDIAGDYLDEVFLPTLAITEVLDPPGGFTNRCLEDNRSHKVPNILRLSHWSWVSAPCYSLHYRHNICVFGIEDIAPSLANSIYMFANKMMPEFDFGAIACWHEEMFNRTHFRRGLNRLNADFYLQLPQVLYHVEKSKKGFVDMDKFDCNYKYSDKIPKFKSHLNSTQ